MTPSTEKRMSLMQHLTELRVRLTRAAMGVILGFFVAYIFHIELFELVIAPVKGALAERGIYNLQAIHVTESILVYLKLSVVAGIVGASPLVFHQFWSFIAPGLTPEERKYITPVAIFSTLFFLLGVAFSYFVLLPFVTGFLTDLTMASGSVTLQVTMQNVFSFTLLSLLIFGVIFELPIIMFFLSLFGIFNYKQFASFFRYFLVIAFIMAALLTPPDPISQVLMAIPMTGLYGLGILISFFVGERKYDDDGKPKPVGGRLWGAVFMCLLLLGLAIYGIVYFLMPGPTPMDVLPQNTVYAIGLNPESTANLGVHQPLAESAFQDETLRSAIIDVLDNEDIKEAVFFGDDQGHHALVFMADAIDASPVKNVLRKKGSLAGEDIFEDPNLKDMVLAVLSDELAVVGHKTIVEKTIRCFEDETQCLFHDESHGKRVDDLRTRAPGWAYVPGDGGPIREVLPISEETADINYLAVLLDNSDGMTMLIEIPFGSEADAAAYRSRVNLWRQQTRTEATRRQQNEALGQEIDGLVLLLDQLAKNTEDSLSAMAAYPIPEGSDTSEFTKQHGDAVAGLKRLRGDIESIRSETQKKVQDESATPKTLFDLIPEQGLSDWTVEAKEKTVTFRLQMTVDGLRGLIAH